METGKTRYFDDVVLTPTDRLYAEAAMARAIVVNSAIADLIGLVRAGLSAAVRGIRQLVRRARPAHG
jgi:hypothetical protein